MRAGILAEGVTSALLPCTVEVLNGMFCFDHIYNVCLSQYSFCSTLFVFANVPIFIPSYYCRVLFHEVGRKPKK